MKLTKSTPIPIEFFESISSQVPNGIYDEVEETAIFPYDCLPLLNQLPMVVDVRKDGVEIDFYTINV